MQFQKQLNLGPPQKLIKAGFMAFAEFKRILTDPDEHDPENFVYLMHGLSHSMYDPKDSIHKLDSKVKRITTPGEFYSASLVGVLDHEMMREKFGFWDTVNQTDLFGVYGFVLNPSEIPVNDEIIKIAWYCDIGTPKNQEEVKRFVQEHEGKVKPPLHLLKSTVGRHPVKYNELVIEGHGDMDIVGVFYKDMNKDVRNKAMEFQKTMEDLLQRKLPLIELPYTTEQISIPPGLEDERLITQVGHFIDLGTRSMALLEFENPGSF